MTAPQNHDWQAIFDYAGDDQEPLGIGSYDAEIVSAKEAMTKSGKPAFRFTFRHEGRPAWLTQMVPDSPDAKGAGFFRDLMRTLGITPEMLSTDVGEALQSVVGRMAHILISKRDSWTDVKVEWLLPENGNPSDEEPF